MRCLPATGVASSPFLCVRRRRTKDLKRIHLHWSLSALSHRRWCSNITLLRLGVSRHASHTSFGTKCVISRKSGTSVFSLTWRDLSGILFTLHAVGCVLMFALLIILCCIRVTFKGELFLSILIFTIGIIIFCIFLFENTKSYIVQIECEFDFTRVMQVYAT